MKLELKHLAPYLPYKIKGRYRLSTVIELSKGQPDEVREKFLTTESATFFLQHCKPILRPLSDLTKEIQIAENYLSFIGHIKNNHTGPCYVDYSEVGITPLDYDYQVTTFLFERHFDVFGLIDKGLAIDINTLES